MGILHPRQCEGRSPRVWRSVFLIYFLLLVCMAKSRPLASLPLSHPQATQANFTGIDRGQEGEWTQALLKFQEVLNFPEAAF